MDSLTLNCEITNRGSELNMLHCVCVCVQAEMALLMEDDGDEAKRKHFNYDKIVEQQNLSKKKRKKLLKKGEEPLEDDDFQVCSLVSCQGAAAVHLKALYTVQAFTSQQGAFVVIQPSFYTTTACWRP